MKKVTDVYGRTVDVDDSGKKVYRYCNRARRITYSAEVIENGEHTGFFTDYEEDGTVDDIEKRLDMFGNYLIWIYADAVGYDAGKNDPDGAMFKDFVERVRANEARYFDEHGDFRRDFVVSDRDIRELAAERRPNRRARRF